MTWDDKHSPFSKEAFKQLILEVGPVELISVNDPNHSNNATFRLLDDPDAELLELDLDNQ